MNLKTGRKENFGQVRSDLRFCTDSDRRFGSLDEIRRHPYFIGVDWEYIRDRPAAYQPRVRSIDDTSNFDEFPDVDLKLRLLTSFHWHRSRKVNLFVCRLAPPSKDSEVQVHDWLFINYTYKRFDGLTAKPKVRPSNSSVSSS